MDICGFQISTKCTECTFLGLQQHFGDMAGAEFKATPPLGCNLFCSHMNAEMVLNVKDRMLLKPPG